MNIIRKVTQLENVFLINKHDNFTIPTKKIYKVEFMNGEIQYLDFDANLNISVADYMKVEPMKNFKVKTLFYYIPLTEK